VDASRDKTNLPDDRQLLAQLNDRRPFLGKHCFSEAVAKQSKTPTPDAIVYVVTVLPLRRRSSGSAYSEFR